MNNDRDNKRKNRLLTHPGARENARQLEMLSQTLEILGQHLERGTWPSKSWMLSEAKAPYGGSENER